MISIFSASAILGIAIIAIYFKQIKRFYRKIEQTRTGQTVIRAGKLSIAALIAGGMDFLFGLDHVPTKLEILMAGKMILIAAIWKFKDGIKLKP
jgi:uncharacterized phosphosugar-binding protein